MVANCIRETMVLVNKRIEMEEKNETRVRGNKLMS
jgi:hypothetical protein